MIVVLNHTRHTRHTR